MSKVSIIIPAYNAEKTIKRSINSLINQTYKDIEILIINDGSNDSTVEEIKSIADKRIRLINQINQGVSVARNNGLLQSTGEFVMYLDADDYYHPSTVEFVIKTFNKYECDIVQFGIKEFSYDVPFFEEESYLLSEKIIGREANLRLVQPGSFLYSPVWNKAYKRNNLIKYKFRENIRYEDEDLLYKIYETAKTICILQNQLYYYYINTKGFMNSSWNNHKLDFIDVFERKINYFKDSDPEIAGRTGFVLCYYFISLYAKTSDKSAKKKIGELYKKRIPLFLNNTYITGVNRFVVQCSRITVKVMDLYKVKIYLDGRGK